METEHKLFEAWAFCDWQDKSTEFMLAYMAEKANVSEDHVLDFIENNGHRRKKWYVENPFWFKKYNNSIL